MTRRHLPGSGRLSGPGRRDVLAGAAAGLAGLGLAGCAGFSRSDSSSGSGSSAGTGGGAAQLTFVNWAGAKGDAEYDAYQKIIDRFNQANPGTTVVQRAVPYGQVQQVIDSGLQAGNAPDIFRVSYIDIGLYTSKGVLADMSDQFDDAAVARFNPALWQAVSYQGKPYGVPQEVDTTALLYRMDAFQAAGITDVPTSLDQAWTWEQFSANAAKLKKTAKANQYPFVYDWQSAGAYRWLTWLYEAGGSMLGPDLTKPALDSAAGRKALDYTKAFFANGWVPRNTSVKSSTYPDSLFNSGTVSMAFAGSFLLPSIDPEVKGKFQYGVMPQPRDVAASSDLGGNAVVATKDGAHVDAAKKFCAFLVEEDNMREFCAATVQLPTLTALTKQKLDYATRPDLVSTFAEQAATLAPAQVAEVTIPAFGAINAAMQNQLETAFLGGKDSAAVLSSLAGDISRAIGS